MLKQVFIPRLKVKGRDKTSLQRRHGHTCRGVRHHEPRGRRVV